MTSAPICKKMMEINVFYYFFIIDFIFMQVGENNHHVAGETRESHPRVKDFQHPPLSKPCHGLYIFDTQIVFSRPSCKGVIDSFILVSEIWQSL